MHSAPEHSRWTNHHLVRKPLETWGSKGAACRHGRARTAAVAGVHVDAQDERVALRRARVAGQHVLERGQKLVAVQWYHAVVVVRCRPRPNGLSRAQNAQSRLCARLGAPVATAMTVLCRL